MAFNFRSGASDVGIVINGVERATINDGGLPSSIRKIDASVTSNAITVSLPPCVLDFRSETLSSSTITTVANNTTLSLTVASTDSFGAVTADGSQRLYILAINNAGTMELAVSRATGGVNLTEEGVITTSATATTATAIKGVGVRTGKAYRVVGCIDVPFTTAVGWGAITLEQGYGGQALAAMSSIGYGQTWQTVTRATGTTYYNTTGKPITLYLKISSASGVRGRVDISINGATAMVAIECFGGTGAAGQNTEYLIIPVGASYGITDSTVTRVDTQELR